MLFRSQQRFCQTASPFLMAAAMALGAALPATSWAQATRTWVSGVGDDVNPCSRTAPCKTFAGAISKTAAGGEISVLDPGGFGTSTITKSITIDGGGQLASILAAATNGININAPAGSKVVLRNLSINGAGSTTGLNGVNVISAGVVQLRNVHIENFSQAGVKVAAASQVEIFNSTMHNTGVGLWVSNANAAAPSNVSLQRSSLAFNKRADGAVQDPATIGAAIWAEGAGAKILVGNTHIFSNAIGVAATASGQIASYGNNAVQGNTFGGSFNATAANN